MISKYCSTFKFLRDCRGVRSQEQMDSSTTSMYVLVYRVLEIVGILPLSRCVIAAKGW
jgi:hypothetical protein